MPLSKIVGLVYSLVSMSLPLISREGLIAACRRHADAVMVSPHAVPVQSRYAAQPIASKADGTKVTSLLGNPPMGL
jgi:hypothetical protein